MPPTKTDPSQPTPGVVERSVFEEPSISAPLDLVKAGERGPMMAMLGGSASPSLDVGGLPPDGLGLDGGPGADGGFGPYPDGGGIDV